jgi:error-prone DNA polymerase
VISEAPLHHLVPVENAAMPERTIIQWDKDDLETLGLLKVDCLALGMLTCVSKCLALLQKHRGWNSRRRPSRPTTAPTYAMIQRADTVGVFQIESRAQMSMLPRMKPANFYDLVIEVALVRPGPDPGKDGASLPAPAAGPGAGALPVRGIEEGVRAHARRAAVPGTGDADGDRRRRLHARRGRPAAALDGGVEAPRRPGVFPRARAQRHGRARLPGDFAEQVFEQIKGFGSYGFPESHSASFALIVYVSCWLKCHQPTPSCARC